MQRLLIVSGDTARAGELEKAAAGVYSGCECAVYESCSQAYDALKAEKYDAVIIDAPISGGREYELAKHIAGQTLSGCLMVCESITADTAELEECGVLILEREFKDKLFGRALKLISASRRRVIGFESENRKLHRKLDEIKIVNRAKIVLMKYLNFSEPQAHRYIEKQSMDLRMSRYDIAMKIIKTYDLDA